MDMGSLIQATRITRRGAMRETFYIQSLMTILASSLLPLSSGCIEGFDSFNGSDEAYFRLYDYHIDRPRVMGVAYWPLQFTGGETVTFEALAASPGQLVHPRVRWYGCGVTVEQPFAYYGTDCLQTSLAEFLGEGETLELRMPDYDTSSCQGYYSCYGAIPVFALVEEEGYEPAQAYGVTFLSPDYLNQYDNIPMATDLHVAEITLSIDGQSPEGLSVAPGARLELQMQSVGLDTDLRFDWYVSAGTLEKYGVTYAQATTGAPPGPRGTIYSQNILQIPADQPAGPLYLYIVVAPVDYYYPGLLRFVTATLEVSP